MMYGKGLAIVLYAAAAAGFAAGKLDLDVKIRDAIRANQDRYHRANAAAIADALESRKLAVPVAK